MIKHVKGDLLDFYERGEIDVLGHVCNCRGVMSSGIALQIKNNHSYAYEAYKRMEEECGGITLGTHSYAYNRLQDRAIVNLHAQKEYGGGKRHLNYEAFYKCLELAKGFMIGSRFKTIGFPKLIGCDRAGGDFRIVLPMIEVVFEDMDVLIVEWDKN
jgi:O-acetyl-ADP-ribose deacetylase (regulator of RNase III)